ncbi:hypothetical protein I4U23_005609 [Adineta vaga]|nr:hypothetical protein I4U23_005609 [Adineta vaga]
MRKKSIKKAFIAVEKRLNGNNDNMILREISIQVSADDQYFTSTSGSIFTTTTTTTSDSDDAPLKTEIV